jgi:hypothetical protein
MTHEVVGSCQGEKRMPEHIDISPAEEGWTVANDNETCLVVALNCNVLQLSSEAPGYQLRLGEAEIPTGQAFWARTTNRPSDVLEKLYSNSARMRTGNDTERIELPSGPRKYASER